VDVDDWGGDFVARGLHHDWDVLKTTSKVFAIRPYVARSAFLASTKMLIPQAQKPEWIAGMERLGLDKVEME